MPEIAIRTQRLTRRFGNLTAVDGVDLQVAAGQFFGFLGPNGAGKSTTIKMLTGLLAPTAGSMDLLGLDFATHPVEVKRQIGVVPEGMGLLERLTGSEYLQFVGRMYGLDRRMTQQRANELLDFMQLADRPKTLIADYSHGMQNKLALAAAVIALIVLLLRSRYGLALKAMRDSELAASCSGVDVKRTKLLIYIVTALATAMLGTLIFLQKLRISPDAAFSVNDWTAFVIFITVIGGIGRIEGPIVGTLIFFVLRQTLADLGTIYLMMLGLVAIVIMLAAPKGLWGLVVERFGWQLFPLERRVLFEERSVRPE